jgi:hypothetical protein
VGGREATLVFIGRRDTSAFEDTLLQVSSPTDADSEVRQELTASGRSSTTW